jgi:hypothetical protein
LSPERPYAKGSITTQQGEGIERLRLGLNQFALHAANISDQLINGQRVRADSEITVLARLELDLRRRRILAVLLPVALPGALSFL